jgi:hypothetical protein
MAKKKATKPRPSRPVGGGPPLASHPDAALSSKHDERTLGNACIGLVLRAWYRQLGYEKPEQATSWVFKRLGQQGIDRHDGDRGSTPNKRAMARIQYYGGEMEQGTEQSKAASRALLIDFFVKQWTQEGLQWGEPNTTSHGQFWLIIPAAAHALALHHRDQELLEVTGEHWRQRAALDDELVDADGHWRSPNARSAGATFDLGTISAHMIRGTAWPETSLIPNARGGPRPMIGRDFWTDSYNSGVWMMRQMIGNDDTLGGATRGSRGRVKLRDPLHIYRRGDDNVKVFPFSRTSDVMFWCAYIDGVASESEILSGRFPQGKANPFPLPVDVSGWEMTVVEGVNS